MPSLIGFRINLKAASFFGERGERLVAYHFQAKAGFNIIEFLFPGVYHQLVTAPEGRPF